MSKRIEYQKGDLINNLKYIREVESVIVPCGQLIRRAVFECPLCGREWEVNIRNITSGVVRSCGCQKHLVGKVNKTHGLKYHPVYNTWVLINQRCYNPRNKSYNYYGAKGISIYEEWKNDFQAFHDYVTSLEGYDPDNIGRGKLSLDRFPDNDGDYKPGNLRWATSHEQAANKRKASGNKTGLLGIHVDGNSFFSLIMVSGIQYRFRNRKTIKEAMLDRDLFIYYWGLWEYPIHTDEYLYLKEVI